jgi:hypothetical protein
MSLSKSKCWYSNNYLHFLKHAVPLVDQLTVDPKFKAPNPPAVGTRINLQKDSMDLVTGNTIGRTTHW